MKPPPIPYSRSPPRNKAVIGGGGGRPAYKNPLPKDDGPRPPPPPKDDGPKPPPPLKAQPTPVGWKQPPAEAPPMGIYGSREGADRGVLSMMAPEGDIVPITGLEVNIARATVGQATLSAEDAPQGTGPTTPTDERTTYDVHGNLIAAPMSEGSTVADENMDRPNVLPES
eukprot:6053688-Karenia_brevis.AAC.1